ncbi:MAG TPA: DUF4178 domain-containing protein [Flavobacterium sp.]|nr:DUF4178 domain-containing protein [Flavobacterium sp.]
MFRNEQGTWTGIRTFSERKYDDAFTVGQKATLFGVAYEVTGVIVKRVYGSYFWKEYILIDGEGNFRFLSESDGHFIFLREIGEEVVNSTNKRAHFENVAYDIYSKTDAQIVSAQGFFDFAIPSGKVVMREYIAPPQMLSFETVDGKTCVYFGEHVSRSSIRKAFGGVKLPYKAGISMVQPFPFPLQPTIVIFGCAILLMIITHVAVFVNQVGSDVLNVTLPFDGKEYVSPTFYLRGGAAPLTIEAQSAVDNSWANISVGLVNEATNEEVYATKDIEYYHGYTDGENWTEGSTNEKFNICGVPAGKYHLVISPSHQSDDQLNRDMTVTATWRDPSMHNIWMGICGLGIVGVAFFGYYRYIETRRWADSPYSPY